RSPRRSSQASVSSGSGNSPNGANPATVAAPSTSARASGFPLRSAIDQARVASRGVAVPEARPAGRKPGSDPGSFLLIGVARIGRQAFHLQQVQAPAVRAQDIEEKVVDADRLAALGQAPEAVDDEAADRVEVVVVEGAAERCVEVLDFGQRLHPVLSRLVLHDVVVGFGVAVLVLHLADYLLQLVLARAQPR